MLITQPSWPTASPILITPSKSHQAHHCRILSTTATTVAFSLPPVTSITFCQPPPPPSHSVNRRSHYNCSSFHR
ncbi:hypothetical protein Bca101_020167 [Brassica carinata]